MASPNTLRLRHFKPKTFAAKPNEKGDKWLPYELLRTSDEPNRRQKREMGHRNPHRKHSRWAIKHAQFGPAEDRNPVSSVATRRDGKLNTNKRLMRKQINALKREAKKSD